jgi:type I restriction enzyme S subunit
MSKGAMKMLVPTLRFPEFWDTGDWSYMSGDKVFIPVSNKNHNSDLPILAITQEHGAIPREQIDYNVSVTEKSIKSYKIVESGDFIISLRSFQGGIEYSNYKGICSPAYIILRNKIDIVDQFYKQYLKTNAFIQDLNKDIEGIRDGKMVSYKQFSDILLPVPDPKEQQKIADCLSSIDELITAHSQKHQALKAHKKGLMQQLFPAADEVNG